VSLHEVQKKVNPNYIDGNVSDPIFVIAGNPPDLPYDDCRFHGSDGICHDPDFECPDNSIICCDDCEDVDSCKYSCQAVND